MCLSALAPSLLRLHRNPVYFQFEMPNLNVWDTTHNTFSMRLEMSLWLCELSVPHVRHCNAVQYSNCSGTISI